MAPVRGLTFHCGIPPAVQVKHVGGLLKIEAQATGAQRQHQDLVRIAHLEAIDHGGSLFP